MKMRTFKGIFEWSEWDGFGDFELYYDCTLLRKIGEYEEDTSFEVIHFDLKNLILYFYVHADEEPAMTRRFILAG